MRTSPPNTETIRRYLLGSLPETEAEALERDYFAREESLDLVSEVEGDLIADHLAGRLEPGERPLFESHYLGSLVHRERVAIELALRRRHWSGRRRTRRLLPAGALAAALAAFVLGGLWFMQKSTPGVDTRLEGAPVTRPDVPQAPAPTPVPKLSIRLPALMVRGDGQTPTVHIADDAASIVFQLERGDADVRPPFSATVRSIEGVDVWNGPATPTAGAAGTSDLATVTVPAASLPGGDYVLALTRAGASLGEGEIQRYFFRVDRSR